MIFFLAVRLFFTRENKERAREKQKERKREREGETNNGATEILVVTVVNLFFSLSNGLKICKKNT